MNTPAHLLLGAAVFGARGNRRVIAAAMAGALVPDLSLYLLAGGSIFVLGYPPDLVFGEFYYSDAWQTVFAVDTSVLVWGVILGLALLRRSAVGMAFAGAGWTFPCTTMTGVRISGRCRIGFSKARSATGTEGMAQTGSAPWKARCRRWRRCGSCGGGPVCGSARSPYWP